jgi:hypothetical protein
VSVPGGNLLGQALRLIKPQSVYYFRNIGRTTSAGGRDVAQYATGVLLRNVSVQAVPMSRYENLGLDFQKRYVSLFAPADITGVARDRSGDRFVWNGAHFDVVKESNWYAQDGWTNIVGVEVPAPPPASQNQVET